jgi:molybdopterin converting factor subunit 1
MQIRVKYFAIIREKINKVEESFSIPQPATTSDLWKLISHQYDLHEHSDYIRFAVNMTYVQNDHQLNDGDVVALITPVAGG